MLATSCLVPGLSLSAGIAQRMRVIPSSAELLPVIGLGTSRVFAVGASPAERSPRREVLEILVRAGASLVDSSPMYGTAEAVVGDLSAELGVIEKLFYATKVWTRGRQAGIEQMNQSFARLRTDTIDLMQIHNLVDWKTHMSTLRDWKEQGKIRYIGITHFREQAFAALEKIILDTPLDFIQFNYSVAERAAEKRLLPLCADKGIATLINRPFQRGALFGAVRGRALPEWAGEFGAQSWGQLFLKFILAHPAVTCVIPATGDPAHAIDNLGAGYGPLPNRSQRQAITELLD